MAKKRLSRRERVASDKKAAKLAANAEREWRDKELVGVAGWLRFFEVVFAIVGAVLLVGMCGIILSSRGNASLDTLIMLPVGLILCYTAAEIHLKHRRAIPWMRTSIVLTWLTLAAASLLVMGAVFVVNDNICSQLTKSLSSGSQTDRQTKVYMMQAYGCSDKGKAATDTSDQKIIHWGILNVVLLILMIVGEVYTSKSRRIRWTLTQTKK